MVRHQKGHKNSKGEKAEWVIVSHKDGHIISSHKTKEEAEKHLTDIRKFKHMGESMDINEAQQILNKAGLIAEYTDPDDIWSDRGSVGTKEPVAFQNLLKLKEYYPDIHVEKQQYGKPSHYAFTPNDKCNAFFVYAPYNKTVRLYVSWEDDVLHEEYKSYKLTLLEQDPAFIKKVIDKYLADLSKFKHMEESIDINEAGFVYVDTEKELERQKKFKERLETYFEDIADIKYAIKNSKAGLPNITMEEMSDYVEDETKFIYKMVRKFANKLEKDWDNCVKED